jgi:hypothetical protein
MSEEQIRRIVEDSYDESREETLRRMVRDFYSRRLRSTAILVYGWGGGFAALAVYGAVQFFKADQTQGQILFATLFILGVHGIGLMKIFAWGMLRQNSVKRDLKRLELRVAELSELLRNKQ